MTILYFFITLTHQTMRHLLQEMVTSAHQSLTAVSEKNHGFTAESTDFTQTRLTELEDNVKQTAKTIDDDMKSKKYILLSTIFKLMLSSRKYTYYQKHLYSSAQYLCYTVLLLT